MRRVVPLLVVAVALAGCLGTGTPGETDDATPDPGNATEPGRRVEGQATTTHVHDLWDGRRSFEVIDRDHTIRAADTNVSGSGPLLQEVGPRACEDGTILGLDLGLEPCLGRVEFKPPISQDPDRPKVFPPGTKQIDITVSWEEPTIRGIRLEATAANGEQLTQGPGFGGDGAATFTESGETVTYTPEDVVYDPEDAPPHFPLEWTDDGHALRSKWRFVATAYGETGRLAVADGTIHVRITVHRTDGELPLEPPHPDWYGSTTGYHVAYHEDTVPNTYQAGPYSLHDATVWIPFPTNPVPPGSDEIAVRVDVTDDSLAADQTGLQVQLGYTPYGAWFVDEDEMTWVEPSDRSGDTYTFRVPLKDWMTDSIYACNGADSTWSFAARVRQDDVVEEDPATGRDHPGAGHFAGRIAVSVAATERPGTAWEDLARDDPEDTPGCWNVRSFYG